MAPASKVTCRPRSKRAATPPPLTIKLDNEDPKAKLGKSINAENQENVAYNISQTESSPKNVEPQHGKQDRVKASPSLARTTMKRRWLSAMLLMCVVVLTGACLAAVLLITTDENTSAFREQAVVWLKAHFPSMPAEEAIVWAQHSSNALYWKIAHTLPSGAQDWMREMHRRMVLPK